MTEARDRVAEVMRKINDAWLAGRVDALAPLVHENIIQALPGFAARVQGRDRFIAGFRDFAENAKVPHFHEGEHQIDIIGRTAAVTFDYEMIYERSGDQYRVTGRDVWIFENDDGAWRAVWRAMLDLNETPVDRPKV